MNKHWLKLLIALLSGATAVLAFEPFAYSWWVLISLGVLFYLWQNASPKLSFFLGFAYGMGLYCAGVSWVYVSLSTYGGMPLWMGAFAVVFFASAYAITIALAGLLCARLTPSGGLARLCLMPPVWVVFEWSKSWLYSGFPWLDMGYTQTNSMLFALAPLGGVYLLTLVVATLVAAVLIMLIHRQFLLPSVVMASLFAVAVWANQQSWSAPVGAPIKAAIVQGNVAIEQKWQADNRDTVIATLQNLSQTLARDENVDLIVWPETALPLYLQQTNAAFWQAITPPNTFLLTGIIDAPNLFKDPVVPSSYNAAVLQCGNQQQVYRKRHLVPFGEYLPFRFLFDWILDYLNLPMSDFASWQGQQTLACLDDAGESIKIGLSICYEDAFAAEVRAHLGDATIMVNISEDAWFGDSLAPHQRLQMGQMRARELARPMVRSANSGPSAFINARGKVLAQTAQFELATLSQTIQPQTGDTPFKRWGNWAVWLCCFLLIAVRIRKLPSQ